MLLSCNIIFDTLAFVFDDITYHLDLVLSASQPHGSETPASPHSRFPVTSCFLTWYGNEINTSVLNAIWRHFFQWAYLAP